MTDPRRPAPSRPDRADAARPEHPGSGPPASARPTSASREPGRGPAAQRQDDARGTDRPEGPPSAPPVDRPRPDRRHEDLAAALFAELFMADQLARARLGRVLPKGMELSHFGVLNLLARSSEERTPAQLARAFHVTRGAMTNTLSRLQWAGHIHIRPDWDDARRKFVSISPAGRQARDAALAAISPLVAESVAALGADRVRAALPVLRALRARLENDV